MLGGRRSGGVFRVVVVGIEGGGDKSGLHERFVGCMARRSHGYRVRAGLILRWLGMGYSISTEKAAPLGSSACIIRYLYETWTALMYGHATSSGKLFLLKTV